MKWFIKCIKNYVNFTGRARRKEYWYFVLFTILFMIVARAADYILFVDKPVGVMFSPISSLFGLFIFLPQVAVMVRRLHDIGRTGKWVLWYYFTGFIWVIALAISGLSFIASGIAGSVSSFSLSFLIVSGVGAVVMLAWAITFLVWYCTPGTVGANEYGPDPKVVEE